MTPDELKKRFEKNGLYDPREEHDACGVGLLVDIEGRRSHSILCDGIVMLGNMAHRGAVGSDPETGDGAGVMLQIPDAFFRNRSSEIGTVFPEPGRYAVAVVFLPGEEHAGPLLDIFLRNIKENGCELLGVRNVPIDPEAVGKTARLLCPDVRQIFVANPGLDESAFERKLYVIRRMTEKGVRQSGLAGSDEFYVCSFSSRTLVYKGMLIAEQIERFYPDLREDDMATAIAVVHQRFSTNTFPKWSLAQPFRMMSHNGEINTIRGNVDRRLEAGEILHGLERFGNTLWGDDLEKILPIFDDPEMSDSALFDNMFELLVLSGRSMAHALHMMMPQAWGTRYSMGNDHRGFFEYHAAVMEPWDGPASIVFSDGRVAGGIMDRNGLRPGRYTVTRQGRVVLASETGVLPIDPADVISHGNIEPGKMFLVYTDQKRIVDNDEIMGKLSRRRPYRRWVEANRIELAHEGAVEHSGIETHLLFKKQLAFGYSREELDLVLRPMYENGMEPIGSMGFDAPLAVLSDRPVLLFDYFKQRFAQVTNPPIDPIREKLLMSLTSFVGPIGSPLAEHPLHARRLKLRTPVLTPLDLRQIEEMDVPELRTERIDITSSPSTPDAMRHAMVRICEESIHAVERGAGILILSDKNVAPDRVAIPSLLAASGLGRFLMRKGIRGKVGIILESGEPRQVHHFAMLLTCGVDAVCPYLAVETIGDVVRRSDSLFSTGIQKSVRKYIDSIDKGLLKILSKMGISTLRSYRGTLSCEAIGLDDEFMKQYFGPIPSRIGGLGFEEIAEETLRRHRAAFHERRGVPAILPSGGEYHNRRDGERHLWNSESIHLLQHAVRNNDQTSYDRFAESINARQDRIGMLRSLMEFETENRTPIPLDKVESAESLMRRFMTGAMSFGSLSREAHETVAVAMNRIGGMSNSGEGGEDPVRYAIRDNENRSSAVKQIASGRFGVTIEYLFNARDLQIKMAQGAKPGEGGHLPGHKVDAEIGKIRHSTPGVSLISPPPHHDIYSIEDLAQLIFDLKNANPEARVSVKLVGVCGVGTIAAGVAKGKADMILISGYDGGTGASPLSSIKNAGIPWELGVAETQQTLVRNELRGRVRLQTDGQMRTGRDVAVAALLGAEEFGFGTAALVSLGCVLMRKCHANMCPVGIATQDVRLRARFGGAADHLVNYFRFVAQELRGIMARLGFQTLDEMVGHSELLRQRSDIDHWKAKKLDLSGFFVRADVSDTPAIRFSEPQRLDGVSRLMRQTLQDTQESIWNGENYRNSYNIENKDRTIGTALSHEIMKRYGPKGLPEDTIRLTFRGAAGQSFGAFAAPGLTLILEGNANDYLGKGLSGGKLIVRVPKDSPIEASKNMIAGKTLFYGATSGEAYINGRVGERFCVRNSGATVVVEGVGDHGCEYMTGGCVAVLGGTGVNFAAGMSGGIAFVYDPHQRFDLKCNLEMVDLEPIFLESDENLLRKMIENHYRYTKSPVARDMLDNWRRTKHLFVKVIPMEYRSALGLSNPVDLESHKTDEQQIHLA